MQSRTEVERTDVCTAAFFSSEPPWTSLARDSFPAVTGHEGPLTGGEKTSLAFWLEECSAAHPRIPIVAIPRVCVGSRRHLLDDLIRAQQQRLRDRDPERLRGLEVDHQFELRGLLDGNVAGLGASQDLVDMCSGTAEHVRKTRSVGDEPPGVDKLPLVIHRR